MIKASSIDHLNIDVRSFKQSCAFYRTYFNFHEYERCNGPTGDLSCIIIGNAEIKLCLYQVPQFELGRGLNHFGFHIEDFDSAYEALQNAGVTVLYGGIVDWGHSRSIYIEDPNGYEIELSEFLGGNIEK